MVIGLDHCASREIQDGHQDRGAQINQPGRSVVSGVGLVSEGYTAIPTPVHVMMNPLR